MKDPIYYYQPDNTGPICPRDPPSCADDYDWRVPKWDRLGELIAFLLLAGCEVAGDPNDENFLVYSFLHPWDAVIHCERSEHGDDDPAINIDALHAIYNHLNHIQQEAISDEP